MQRTSCMNGAFLFLFAAGALLANTGCQRHSPMERTISIELTVPDPAWQVVIDRVYLEDDRLVAVSKVERDPEAMAAQVISQASDTVRLEAPDLPIEHYVLGKTWGWAEEDHRFLEDERQLQRELQGARLLYDRGSLGRTE